MLHVQLRFKPPILYLQPALDAMHYGMFAQKKRRQPDAENPISHFADPSNYSTLCITHYAAVLLHMLLCDSNNWQDE